MTNMFRKQQGVATLLITVIMLASITLIILAAASYNILQQKVTSNSSQNTQAYEAAEAGLEFGIVYLQKNSGAILASPVNGYIPAYSSSNTQNVALANGSKFSIAYTNPVQNNYSLILITSVGTSPDSTATHTVMQQVSVGSFLSTPPTVPLISKGSIAMSGSSVISNPQANSTITTGSTIVFTGNSQTLVTGGIVGSNSSHIGSDVQQSNSAIAAMSNTTFFQTYFGASETAVQPTVKYTYTNSSSTDYSTTLNGKTGTSIWINQAAGTTATIGSNSVIGSAANPVLLIVNGSLNITGNAIFYGFIYVIGGVAVDLTGNSTINGGVVSTDNLSITGNTTMKYNTTVLGALQKQVETTYYSKVPGTWRDF
jgi:Tfp pilus assembly protein PilX